MAIPWSGGGKAGGKGKNPAVAGGVGSLYLGQEVRGKSSTKKLSPDRSCDVYENKIKIDILSDKMTDTVPDLAVFRRHLLECTPKLRQRKLGK